MAFIPAKDVYLSVNGTNIAAYCDSIESSRRSTRSTRPRSARPGTPTWAA
jgi:hypothetical protein